MPTFSPKFFSVIFLGSQNPQILNHDFLINNQVLPIKKEPFRSLMKNFSKGRPPFTHYLSTPLVTALNYEWISIVVEPERYQIKDSNFKVPSKSPIVSITKSYFGQLLRYTPFRLGGINFGGEIGFLSADDERDFDKRLGIDSQKLEACLKTVETRFSAKIKFLSDNDQENRFELRVDKPDKFPGSGTLNFNYEFMYRNIDSFIGKLDKVDRIHNKFKQILKELKLETKQ